MPSNHAGQCNCGYFCEEPVAELGYAFLCADLELTPEVRNNHSADIASWLKVLENDKRAVFCAAAHAQRATVQRRQIGVDFMLIRAKKRRNCAASI